ncbi:MAG TPA: hypothetical protein VGK90_14650 [Rhizomicrobium sp.]|jgi:hypothetical protein
MRIILVPGFLLAMVQPALCGAVADFLKLHDEALGQSLAETQIAGIQGGLTVANSYLTKTRNEAPMYCQPETLSLTAGQLIDMLRRDLKEQPELDDQTDLGSALLAVMQHTFPCPQKSN